MIEKRLFNVTVCLLLAMGQVHAGDKLSLRDITRGEFRQETMTDVRPMADGETYAQISADGKRIVTYSFKTGKQVGVLFDATTARGAQISRVQGYIVSPDGRRLLIQTKTKSIYRRSLTAEYYIFLALKSLQLNPEISTICLRSKVSAEDKMSLYRYFKAVESL